MPNGVEFEGRLAHVGTFPIGIDPQAFLDNLEKESVKNRITELEQRFNGVKLIVGVDRLDYIKGVPQKMHALELFLTQHPEWIGKVSQGSHPHDIRNPFPLHFRYMHPFNSVC